MNMVGSSAPPLVLVAEDEPTMLELVAHHLKMITDPKLEVIEASDGDEAWRLAMDRLPDLVVLDVMMPGMSGWEVCKKIREDKGRFAHTGVVMLTGIGEKVNEMTSPLYGADAYIDKPFEFEELDVKVREVLVARAKQRNAAPRPVRNGVHVAARAASTSKTSSKGGTAKSGASATRKSGGTKATPPAKASFAKSTKPAAAKRAPAKKTTPKTQLKKQMAVSSNKGKETMAAKKKSAKKGAKKAAKKGAKKASKKK
jgi:DNA-binding response OmpR family regulator